jgi:hypothetical protein
MTDLTHIGRRMPRLPITVPITHECSVFTVCSCGGLVKARATSQEATLASVTFTGVKCDACPKTYTLSVEKTHD